MAYLDENGLKAFFDLLVEKGDLTWYDEEEDGWTGVKSSYATTAGAFYDTRNVSLQGDVTGGQDWNTWGSLLINTTIANGAVTAEKLGSDVGIVAVSGNEPTDDAVMLWVQI